MVSLLASAASTSLMDHLYAFFKSLAELITAEIFGYCVAGLLGILLIYGIVRISRSYEVRSLKAIKKITKYLESNPQVKDSTLVEFHKQMQRLPAGMRDRWHLYMLERDGAPSNYMNVEQCVERPLRYSSIISFLKQFKAGVIIISAFALLFSAAAFVALGVDPPASSTLRVSVLPLAFVIVCMLFNVIVQARYDHLCSDLYANFAVFMRNIDKATITMPDYVDYELLFTKKEIRVGLPMLREYLEKRDFEEQRLIEEAKKNAVEYSPYKFDDLGVDGALLLERAVHESEAFLLTRIRLQSEITDLNKDMERSKQGFEDIEKEAHRKLQTIKENLDRLKKQAEESTNRIEVNYIRKQEGEELKKQTFIERDLEEYRKRADDEQKNLTIEIQKRKETIEAQHTGIEEALKSEYNTFSAKVYEQLNKKMSDDHNETIRNYEDIIARYKAKAKELALASDNKDSIIEARDLEIENLRANGGQVEHVETKKNRKRDRYVDDIGHEPRSYNNDAYNASHDLPEPEKGENLINTAKESSVDEYADYSKFYDDNGTAIDFTQPETTDTSAEEDSNYDDYSQYYDAKGNLIDYSKNYNADGSYVSAASVPFVSTTQKAQNNYASTQTTATAYVPPVGANSSKPIIVVEAEGAPAPKPVSQPKPVVEEKSIAKPAVTKPKSTTTKPTKKPAASATGRRLTTNRTKASASSVNAKASATPSGAGKSKQADAGVELDDLMKLQKAIEKENSNLIKQQEELRSQISTTLKDLDETKEISKQERNKRLKQLKSLIEDLKVQAQTAKANGASKQELKEINKSTMDLLAAIAKYSSEK